MSKFTEVTEQGIICAIPANQENVDTGIWLKAGFQYSLSAKGTWTDLTIDSGPEGFERWYMSPFKLFRRHRIYPWFALMGKVAVAGSQPFLIGRQTAIIPPVSGPLLCYANDVLGFFYKNNRGAVRLKIVLLLQDDPK